MSEMFVTKRNGTTQPFLANKVVDICNYVCRGLSDVDAEHLAAEVSRQVYPGIHTDTIYEIIVLTARTMMVNDGDNYTYVAARTLLLKLNREVVGKSIKDSEKDSLYRQAFIGNVHLMIQEGLLSDKLLDFDLQGLSLYLKLERDNLIQYPGAQTLYDRYFIHKDGRKLESLQGFFMRVAMGLSINETDKMYWAKRFYDKFSELKYLPSTPSLFNSGTPRSQLSSCFISTVPDDLEGIFGAIYSQAMLSKWAGGLAVDWSYVRGIGSHIKGTNGKSQGVVPWMKVFNDTLVSTNQGGKRKGSGCSYLETSHIEIEEFLELKKNTGDERRRTHDMNTSNWIPDLFIKRVVEDSDWTLFCPSEAGELHDLYGEAYDIKYKEYESLAAEGKIKNYKVVKAKSLWRKMLTSLVETGHPWICFKDACNIRYTNKNAGVVHSSNLCCIGKNDRVSCNLGLVTIEELYKLQQEITVVGREKYEQGSVMYLPRPNTRMVKICTKQGYSHNVTPDHPVFIKNHGWKNAEELIKGDKILIQQIEGIFGKVDMPEEALLLGLIAGDGSLDEITATIRIYDKNWDIKDEVKESLVNLIKKYKNKIPFNKQNPYKDNPEFFTKDKESFNVATIKSSALRDIFRLVGVNINNKMEIPEFVWSGNKKTVCSYLKGIFATDGSCYGDTDVKCGVHMCVSSVHKSYLENLQILISNLGIKSSISKVSDGGIVLTKFRNQSPYSDTQAAYRLKISGVFNCNILDGLIQLSTIRKNEKFKRVLKGLGKSPKKYCVFSHIEEIGIQDAYCLAVNSSEHSWTVNGLITKNTEITLHNSPTLWKDQVKDTNSQTAVCNLASPNLAAHVKNGKIDWEELGDTISVLTRGLDNVIDINYYPIDSTREANQKNRPIGVGLMGLADVFQMLDIVFDSDEAIKLGSKIQEFISFNAIKTSCELAKERGVFNSYKGSEWDLGNLPVDTYINLMKYRDSNFNKTPKDFETLDGWDKLRTNIKKFGMRNSNTQSPPPSATISTIAGCSPTAEPIYSVLFTYSTMSGELPAINVNFVNKCKELGIWDKQLINKLKKNDGDIKNLHSLPQKLRDVFKTAFEVDQHKLIDAAAARQIWIDQSQSINLFYDGKSLKKLSEIYLHAWRSGLKTTYYLRSKGASRMEKVTLDANKPEKDAVSLTEGALACSIEAARNGVACESCQ